jgi:hypothetical protein
LATGFSHYKQQVLHKPSGDISIIITPGSATSRARTQWELHRGGTKSKRR